MGNARFNSGWGDHYAGTKMKELWLDTSRMSDGELADLIHELNNELERRCQKLTGSWLNRQLDAASLSVRSWSTQHQKNMRAWRNS